MHSSFVRFMLIAGALSSAAAVQADQRIQLPDGRGCWQNNVGYVYGCDPQPQQSHNSGGTSSEPECRWHTEKEWERCERLKNWPAQPSNCDHLLPQC